MAKRFRSAIRLAILLAALLPLSGCPLYSDYPLSEPADSKLDDALIGAWCFEAPGSHERGSFTFAPFNEREFVGMSREEASGKVELFRVFTTELAGERYLNARSLGPGSSGWYILRYRIEGSSLALSLIDDELFRGLVISSSAELRAFVERNATDGRLFTESSGGPGSSMRLERVKD